MNEKLIILETGDMLKETISFISNKYIWSKYSLKGGYYITEIYLENSTIEIEFNNEREASIFNKKLFKEIKECLD